MLMTITRLQEQELYKFLRKVSDGDCLLYELIAKKIMHVADAVAADWEAAIVSDWLKAMNEVNAALTRVVESSSLNSRTERVPFETVRRGKVDNPHYQAFLDTLEAHELSQITSNAPYFAWLSARNAEIVAQRIAGTDYVRKWADEHLSTRVQEGRKGRGLP